MTKGTFGDNLKREREMRGVSLDEISAATRIATRFLVAIENEQWDQLPGGVFNRGFVRAVAHYLGLDEENVVAEYVMAADERQTVPVWTGSPPAVTPQQPWLAWIGVAIVVVALLVGSWLGAKRMFAWRAAKRAARAAELSAAQAPDTQETPSIPVSEAAPADASANPATTPETPAGTTDSGQGASAVTQATSTAVSPVTPPVPTPFELKIEAGKKTKVTVDADADRVFNGTMKAGENHTFTAKDQFEVSARDAGALLLEVNGKTLAPIGPPGHAGKVTVTREALKGASGGGN